MSVSYLITLYNKEDHIAAVMDAVLAEQADTGGEIVVYDDCATDRSPEIVGKRIAAHPAQAGAVRVIRGDKNIGVSEATNRLIELAAQPYTRLVDADDVLVKGSTAHLLRLLQDNGLGFIHGLTTEIGNEPPGLDNQPFTECLPIVKPVRVILRHAIAGASPSLFVTEILKKAAPLPPLKRGQDFLLTLRVANSGARMGYVKDIVSVGPSDRTGNNLSAALAFMFAEMSRGVAHDGDALPLNDLRYAARRYAGRTSKYFRRRGQSKLSAREKFDLWRWRNFGWLTPRPVCIARIDRTAELLDRDRDVLVTGPAGSKPLRRLFPRRWPMFRLCDEIVARIPAPKKKQGVVILRMFGLGDALLFRVVLEKYAEALGVPLSDITILGSTAWEAAVSLFFCGVKIRLIDERRFTRDFFYRLRIMFALRRRGFKTAICGMRLRYPHVVESLMLASGADRRIVAAARPNEKFDAMFAHYGPLMTQEIALPESEKPRAEDGSPRPLTHEIEHQLAFLSAIAGRPIRLEKLPNLTVRPGPSLVSHNPYAVLNIGASHAPRRWPIGYFFDMARRFLAQGYAVVFLGGSAEKNLVTDVSNFKAGAGRDGARIMIAIGSLEYAAAARLVDGAAAVVSNDSGLGHLAIMLGKPSVLIVGGGHFGAFMPYPPALTPPHVRFLYQPMPCYHCDWNCTMMPPGGRTFPCVGEVTPEKTWDALQSIAG